MNLAKKSAEKATADTLAAATARSIKPARFLFLGALLLLVLWLGLKGWTIGRALLSLQARQSEVETLLADGWREIDPAAAEDLVMGLRQDFVVVKRETAVFMPLMPYLDWVPRYGSTLAAAPALVDMADAGTETAVYAIRSFKPALNLLQEEKSATELLPELLETIQTAQPELTAINASMAQLAAARAELGDISALPGQLRTLLELADTWLPLAQGGLKLAPYLPEIMGSDGTRTYLIIAQNEDEMRPTGGFVSGAGLLVLENGRIADLTFQDANNVDNWEAKPYDFPPQPLYNFMRLELFLFRDANFWPDFPTSAEKLLSLYSYGQDVPPPDGLIAIDQRFFQLLIESIGQVEVPDLDITLTSQNSGELIREAWTIEEGQEVLEWIYNRKNFLDPLAKAIMQKLESDAVDPLPLAQNMYAALQSKDLQIYLHHPEAALILSQLNWDGRLPQNPNHDFLMVVDTNVGYGKSNLVVNKQLDYQVIIDENDSVQAQLSAAYEHTGEEDELACTPIRAYNLETAVDYYTLVNRCYWNYLRLYTPNGSQLRDASSHTIPAENTLTGQSWEGSAQAVPDITGLTTFATYFLLPNAQQITSQFSYTLPPGIIHSTPAGKQYDLLIYKQAGTRPEPVHIVIQLPAGAQLIDAQPAPTQIEANRIHFNFDLTTNTYLSVQYQLPD